MEVCIYKSKKVLNDYESTIYDRYFYRYKNMQFFTDIWSILKNFGILPIFFDIANAIYRQVSIDIADASNTHLLYRAFSTVKMFIYINVVVAYK